MSKQEDEIQRLIRIRDQQVQARDPLKKQKRLNREVARRHRQAAGSFSYDRTIGEMFSSLSHRLRGGIYGLLLGTAATVVITLTIQESWAPVAGLVLFFLFPLVGLIIGAAFDWRDRLRDELKR